MGLVLSVLRYLVYRYSAEVSPGALQDAHEWARVEHGPDTAEIPFNRFLHLFPAEPVCAGQLRPEDFVAGDSRLWSNRDATRCELLLLYLATANHAMAPYRLLFDDSRLKRESEYVTLVSAMQGYLRRQPPFPGTRQDLITMLYAPILAAPDSLEGQLRFIRDHWTAILPASFRGKLAFASGVLREEQRMRGLGPGPVSVLEFGRGDALAAGYEEPEAYSVDKDWMPNVVLLAKTVYVWLDQLSRRYGRPITRLDQIPDEELDRLASWGFTGLWLIGIWERSEASRTIKQKMGNPEAAASAYSLYDYIIAWDLGGDDAYRNLSERAWKRGIRLASDMVPNHVGIYSKWVVEHPDWFIQSPHPPFPGYTFQGDNLSSDGRVGIYIEDGYWDHRDAAVVFKRVDHWSGETRYIYHGNDGTSMPWNDTAQLNYLIPEVREAVIQTILHVARHFPIIRFDAAMTLAKKHFQRLWFPMPDDAGAIPSRAEHSMSRAEFDAVFPLEFWREVVDRVAAEAPDTLLLAEAFWLMEGYFVRTLGMHRVYNSAFMNMLKMEDNQKYRQTIKNVLEFSPEILQRFVNFMNNPDEDTAQAQFGKDDKYFGVAAMLVTMPGLPMIGHGQVEGYAEKYGMEYRRAYYDEQPNEGLIQRHEREIFPLMRQRHLFSGAEHFAFYDFVTSDGWVDENVFAYSNRRGADCAVIVYQNAFRETQGRIHHAVPRNKGAADDVQLQSLTLATALNLHTDDNCYYIYRDARTGLEYLEHAQRLRDEGLYIALGAYHYAALINWRPVFDVDLTWGRLHESLAGRGVPSIDEAYQELHLAPILEPFGRLLTPELLLELHEHRGDLRQVRHLDTRLDPFLDAVGERLGITIDPKPLTEAMRRDLTAIYDLPRKLRAATTYPDVRDGLLALFPDKPGKALAGYRVPLVWALLRHLGAVLRQDPKHPEMDAEAVSITSGAWIREWFLRKPIANALAGLGADGHTAALEASLVRICIAHAHHLRRLETEVWGPVLDAIFADPDVLFFLRVNTWQGRRWLNRERLEEMAGALQLVLATVLLEDSGDANAWDTIAIAREIADTLLEAAEGTNYDLDWMLSSIK
ncbi:MAG: alpha-amylase [Candidatus Hydrogenedentes bacterium]|nr:alpha-amylase [Candidatus Hydrogenedentota bacterium]